METITEIINIVKWPIVVIIAMLIFKKPISSLINRLRKVGHGNTAFEADGISQESDGLIFNKEKSKTKEEVDSVDHAINLFSFETIEDSKKEIIKR